MFLFGTETEHSHFSNPKNFVMATYGDPPSVTLKLFSARPVGAPVFKDDRFENGNLVHCHSFADKTSSIRHKTNYKNKLLYLYQNPEDQKRYMYEFDFVS